MNVTGPSSLLPMQANPATNAQASTSATKTGTSAATTQGAADSTVRGGPLVRTPSDTNVQHRLLSQLATPATASFGGVRVGQLVRTLSDDDVNGNFERLMALMPHSAATPHGVPGNNGKALPAMQMLPHPSLPLQQANQTHGTAAQNPAVTTGATVATAQAGAAELPSHPPESRSHP